jgi:hypothetical protein
MTFADSTPDQTDLPWNIALLGVIFRWGLILAGILLLAKSISAWNLRRSLRADYAAQAELQHRTTEVKGTVTVAPGENSTTITANLEGEAKPEG